jgi:diadenosine tetraphosphate (Ap4A) HIT family hydrolase
MRDMVRIGDALLKATNSYRINYQVLGNSEPELHAHIFPRHMSEAEDMRRRPAWFYDWQTAVRYSENEHGHLRLAIREQLRA